MITTIRKSFSHISDILSDRKALVSQLGTSHELILSTDSHLLSNTKMIDQITLFVRQLFLFTGGFLWFGKKIRHLNINTYQKLYHIGEIKKLMYARLPIFYDDPSN